MRLHAVSDLHLEFGWVSLPIVEADVLILAGDIGVKSKSTVDWLQEYAPAYKAVIHVPGNHEYYGSEMHEVDKFFTDVEREIPNYRYANDHLIEVGDQRFICSPLWTNYRGSIDAEFDVRFKVNDFRQILYNNNRLLPSHYTDLYEKSVKFMRELITPDTVVVTHWAPIPECQDPNLPNDSVSWYFVNDLRQLVLDTNPKLWITGHTHYNVDFMFGKTRIFSNQAGYPEEHTGFDPSKVVEV